MYELCALDHAFNGQGLMGVMYKIVEGDTPDLPKKYSRELNAVLKKFVLLPIIVCLTTGVVMRVLYLFTFWIDVQCCNGLNYLFSCSVFYYQQCSTYYKYC